MRNTLALVLFGGLGCAPADPDYASLRVEVVAVYHEERFGSEDWTTVVEFEDGHRYRVCGKLGEVGEHIVREFRFAGLPEPIKKKLRTMRVKQ